MPLNAVSRLSLKVASTLKNNLETVFCVSKHTSIEDVCDLIKNQWQIYQLLDIPKEWHCKETDSGKKERITRESYWKNVEKSWIDITPKEFKEKTVRIDCYWSRVFNVKDAAGRYQFPQLTPFVKSILTLSHGNAGPEQGFSINKSLLDVHGARLSEDMIVALRTVKHRLIQVGGLAKFEINRPLLESVKLSRSKYEEQKELALKAKSAKRERETLYRNQIEDIDGEIHKIQQSIEIADKVISDGSSKLEKHLTAKTLDLQKLQADNSLIQMGIQCKQKLTKDLSNLIKNKKAKLSKK